MARSKKTSRGSVTATATVATPWEGNRVVLQATRKINALERDIAGKVVDAVVRAGSLLAQVQDELPRGEWLRWLDKGVHFDVRTAERCSCTAVASSTAWGERHARRGPRLSRAVRGGSVSYAHRQAQ